MTRMTSQRQVSSPTPPRSVPAAGEQASAFNIGLPSTNGMRGAGRFLNNLIAHLRRAHRFDIPRYVQRVNGQRDERLDREFRRYADSISRCLSARTTMFDRDVEK